METLAKQGAGPENQNISNLVVKVPTTAIGEMRIKNKAN